MPYYHVFIGDYGGRMTIGELIDRLDYLEDMLGTKTEVRFMLSHMPLLSLDISFNIGTSEKKDIVYLGSNDSMTALYPPIQKLPDNVVNLADYRKKQKKQVRNGY